MAAVIWIPGAGLLILLYKKFTGETEMEWLLKLTPAELVRLDKLITEAHAHMGLHRNFHAAEQPLATELSSTLLERNGNNLNASGNQNSPV